VFSTRRRRGLSSATSSNDLVGLTNITIQISDTTAGAPNFSIGGTEALVIAGLSVDVISGDTVTISLAMSGDGAVTKSGAGTVILSGANSYTGTDDDRLTAC
jgi:hypothetical protein